MAEINLNPGERTKIVNSSEPRVWQIGVKDSDIRIDSNRKNADQGVLLRDQDVLERLELESNEALYAFNSGQSVARIEVTDLK